MVSIIIVSHNTRDLLKKCLEQVTASSYSRWEIIVVDNASNDGTVEMLRAYYGHCRLISNQNNRGFAAANNQAAAIASGECLLLLNSDAFVQQDAIEQMVLVLERMANVGIVGPRLLNEDGSIQESHGNYRTAISTIVEMLIGALRLPEPARLLLSKTDVLREGQVAGWLTGACLMIRRGVYRELGGLDENYFFASEDEDLCARSQKAGWDIYFTPQAEVTHALGASRRKYSGTPHEIQSKCRDMLQKRYFLRKHRGIISYTFCSVLLTILCAMNLCARCVSWLVSLGASEHKAFKVTLAKRLLQASFAKIPRLQQAQTIPGL